MMQIFKNPSLYLSALGFVSVLILMNILGKQPPPQPPTREPAANPYYHAIAASGIIESADRNISIGVPTSGIATNVYVLVGDPVEEDAPLFQIDPRELEAELIELKAKRDVAKAQEVRIESQLAKLQRIEDKRAISQEDLDTRANDLKVAKAQVEAAEAALQKTLLLLNRMTVRAPKKGIILQSNIRKGEYVLAGTTTPAMILGDVSQLQVRIDIDEQNASHYRDGLPAFAFLKNDPSVRIPLNFLRVEPYVIPKKSLTGASEERVDTRVLQVIYTIVKDPENRLFVGQQVDVFIELESETKK
ncbi:efflux RND transporter periplasmic adaptor subunit [Estrella lausannensis]|uniref:HlyD family secretion protein n=1 Tax=Estrella lausannensis TaxID=483423 RepID=A0A0H5DR41_9BACT|nr:efflux RND transporter periplasmic adaptor subunit [Estrella lausannensis]CRX38613.1 HlyD family secretion protein [Estrella lausannensis]